MPQGLLFSGLFPGRRNPAHAALSGTGRARRRHHRRGPVAPAPGGSHGAAEIGVDRLRHIARRQFEAVTVILDWLRIEHGIEKPPQALRPPWALDADGFVAAVRGAKGRRAGLSAAAVQDLRREYGETIAPGRPLVAEAGRLERRLAGLVNEAYGLTPEEVALMWRTAPPRMPVPPPAAPDEESEDAA